MDNILLRFQENWQFWIIFLCLASLGSGMVKIINLLNDISNTTRGIRSLFQEKNSRDT